MAKKNKLRPLPLQEGYQPKPLSEKGYQPEQTGYEPGSDAPTDIENVKPPSGGSAIQPAPSDTQNK